MELSAVPMAELHGRERGDQTTDRHPHSEQASKRETTQKQMERKAMRRNTWLLLLAGCCPDPVVIHQGTEVEIQTENTINVGPDKQKTSRQTIRLLQDGTIEVEQR